MVVITMSVQKRSLDFKNMRKVIELREKSTKGKKMQWDKIAEKVVNLEGEHPSPWLVANIYKQRDSSLGYRKYKYDNCGRSPWKVDKSVEHFLVRKLLQLRKQSICTSTVLQRELAQEKQVELDTSTIRKVLGRQGFKWLPRAQKPKYDKNAKKARLKFANYILRMTVKKLREWLSFAMDGVILTIPPSTDDVARENYCRFGDTHMWRKPEESASPELAGDDPFGKQVPIGRAIPIWGGISEGGFSVVLHHPKKKVHATEWAEAVNKGKLTQAVKALRPVAHKGPWNILCDNESFLSTAICREAHAKHKIKLHHIPAKSPDLNPVERYWGWLRKQMRAKDLADLRAGRHVLGKTAYRQRLMRFLKTKKAQSIASGMAKGLRNVCKLVVQKKGAASGK